MSSESLRVSPLLSATRIVATIGPASSSEAVLRRMMKAGVDVFRFNMSHGDHASHDEAMRRVRRVAASLDRPVGVLVDLQGPKIRTRKNASGGMISLRRGQEVTLSAGSGTSEPGHIRVDFAGLFESIAGGDEILLDDGRLSLEITDVAPSSARAVVTRGGSLKERAGVNVPGRRLRVTIPTAKDRRDARFAIEHGADFIALSFVQSADDVTRLRRLIARHQPAGRGTGPEPFGPWIVSKLEKPAALENLDPILDATDGVMVARGDLGVELSLSKVPIWQKEILRRAREHGRFTVTATQMLESMVERAVPTRAEVSDVANAIFDGTDAVMLSAETATGRYPVEAVRALTEIASEVETDVRSGRTGGSVEAMTPPVDKPVEAVVQAAVELAERADARWIVIFTLHGRTCQLLARHRPQVGILALTPHEEIRRRLSLAWNVRTLEVPLAKSSDELMRRGIEAIRRARLVKAGDRVVIVAGDPGMDAATNLLRLVQTS
jgi:pyruvate kinase